MMAQDILELVQFVKQFNDVTGARFGVEIEPYRCHFRIDIQVKFFKLVE